MGRLTYQHDSHWCIDGKKTVSDTQANCWGAAIDLLAAYENTSLTPEQIQEAVDLLNDSFYDADIPKELLSWVERCTWHVRKCNELHAELEKYRALGTVEELAEMRFGKGNLPKRWMTEEIERANAIKLLFPKADIVGVSRGSTYAVIDRFGDGDTICGKTLSFGDSKMILEGADWWFPTLKDGETAKLDDIIGADKAACMEAASRSCQLMKK